MLVKQEQLKKAHPVQGVCTDLFGELIRMLEPLSWNGGRVSGRLVSSCGLIIGDSEAWAKLP